MLWVSDAAVLSFLVWSKPVPATASPPPPPSAVAWAFILHSFSLILPAFIALVVGWVAAAYLFDVLTFRPFVKPAKSRRGLGNDRWAPGKVVEGEVDVIIIGSGMAGLSCAAVLSSFGKRVVVLEQHETVGGGAHCYAVEGKSKWKFDSGLHYTIPQAAGLLALACGSVRSPVRLSAMGSKREEGNVYDRVLLAGSGEEALGIVDDAKLVAELKRRFPQPELTQVAA